MAYINIPSLNYNNLSFSFIMKDDDTDEKIFISHSLNHYLSNIKQQIDQYYSYWDYYKKITNTFEFIGRFKNITEDIELLLNNSINISWFYLIVLFFILFFIVKSLSKNISKNHFKQLLS